MAKIILFLVYAVISAVSGQMTVVTSQGTVLGSVASDGEHIEFYGIPFAGSTSGSQRFKAPTAPPIFEDTFVADRRDIKCVRPLGVGYEGTEDCLVANVFTPDINPAIPMPVVVWIKGRELDETDELELSFRNFMEQNVIVVALNFRESILGFLCLGTETAPGNAGLKDIVAGLRWVQTNIAGFGGNPNDVTLMGHGTGASAVDLVSLSPLANGLIQRVIVQSGNALSAWAVTRDPTLYAIEVAEALGHIITDKEELSSIFSRTSVAALMGVINELKLLDNYLAFSPCIENEYLVIENDEHVLTQSPYEIIISGNYSQLPILIGYVENEGTVKISDVLESDLLLLMDESFSDFIQTDLIFETEEQKNSFANEIRNYYFQDAPINMDTIENFVQFRGDAMIKISTLREARLRALFTPATYVYQFSYKGSFGESFAGPLNLVGANHGEELGYLFYTNQQTDIQIEMADFIMSYIIVERWTNFAKTGNPTSSLSTVTWLPITADSINAILMRNEETETANPLPESLETIIVNPNQNAFEFWNSIYEENFLDAEGVWTQSERDDEDDEEVVTSIPDVPENPEVPDNPEELPEEGIIIEDLEIADSSAASIGGNVSFIVLISAIGYSIAKQGYI